MDHQFRAPQIDVQAFAEAGGSLTCDSTIGEHWRLLHETGGEGAGRPLTWTADGELRNRGHAQPQVWLRLQAQTVLPLLCQRCLGPVEVVVEVDRRFRFVGEESTAAAQDDLSEEDVLVLHHAFDLASLVEDELLMELPAAPRHETCPLPVQRVVADAEFEASAGQKAQPFAVLKALRPGKH